MKGRWNGIGSGRPLFRTGANRLRDDLFGNAPRISPGMDNQTADGTGSTTDSPQRDITSHSF
jgi:hypothetical protein